MASGCAESIGNLVSQRSIDRVRYHYGKFARTPDLEDVLLYDPGSAVRPIAALRARCGKFDAANDPPYYAGIILASFVGVRSPNR
jgi:hypothetical protein